MTIAMTSDSDRVAWLPIKFQELSHSRKCHAEGFLRPWSSKSCSQWKQAWGARNVPPTDHRGFPLPRRGLAPDAPASRADEFLNSELSSLFASHVERAADEGVNLFAEAPVGVYLGRTNEVVCDYGWCNRSVKSPSRIIANRGRCQSAGVRRPTSAASSTRARPRTAVAPRRSESRGTSDAGSTAGSERQRSSGRHTGSRCKSEIPAKDDANSVLPPPSSAAPRGASQGTSDVSFRSRNRPASAVSRPPDTHSSSRREPQRRPESAPSQLPTAPTHGAAGDRRESGSSQGSLQGVRDAGQRAAEQRALVTGGTPQFGRDALAWGEDSRFEVVTLDTDRSSLDQVLG